MLTWYMGQVLTNIGVLGAIFIVNKYMFLFSIIVLILLSNKICFRALTKLHIVS